MTGQRKRKQVHTLRDDPNDEIEILEIWWPPEGFEEEEEEEAKEEEEEEEDEEDFEVEREVDERGAQQNIQKYEDNFSVPTDQTHCMNGEYIDSINIYKILEEFEQSPHVNTQETKKQSIQWKLANSDEHLLTKAEEEEINKRAEAYVLNVYPDRNYYSLPETSNQCKQPLRIDENINNDQDLYFPLPFQGKRKRRSYDNFICYVTHCNGEDSYDNSHILPKGTRLLKPPNKLVELVAQAINDSPDGLLQVHQIYALLQNKYPYFRYMEKSAINSWRSSIRHALYQKWFRKIHLKKESINSKGCYWTINRKFSPKNWTMPESQGGNLLTFPRVDISENFNRNIQPESFASEHANLVFDAPITEGYQIPLFEEFPNFINIPFKYPYEADRNVYRDDHDLNLVAWSSGAFIDQAAVESIPSWESRVVSASAQFFVRSLKRKKKNFWLVGGLVFLWHINPCELSNTKSCFYIWFVRK